jgi:hypothetical protein
MKVIFYLIILFQFTIAQQQGWYKPELQPFGGTVVCIDVDRENADNVWIVTDIPSIYYSSNGGESWNELPNAVYQIQINTNYINPFKSIRKIPGQNKLLLGTVSGLFSSIDNGVTWQKIDNPGLTRIEEIHIGSNPAFIYVRCETTFYRSTDYGVTWEYISYYGNYRFSEVNDSLIIHFSYNELRISSDAGNNWLSLGILVHDILIDPIDSYTFYAVQTNQQIWQRIIKTSDRGATWITIRDNVPAFYGEGYIFNHYGETRIITESFFYSTDGGYSWHQDIYDRHAQHFCYSGGKLYAGLRYFGAAVSINGGAEWTMIDKIKAHQIKYLLEHNNRLFALTNRSVFLLEDISSQNWKHYSQHNISGLNKIIFISDSVGFVISSGMLLRTTNLGETWEEIPFIGYYIHDIDTIDGIPYFALEGHYFTGNNHGIYRAFEDGRVWQLMLKGLNHRIIRDNKYLYGISDAGSSKVLKKSTDKGVTWSDAAILNSSINYTISAKKDFPPGVILGGSAGSSGTPLYFLPTDGNIREINLTGRVASIAVPADREEFFYSTYQPDKVYRVSGIDGDIVEWEEGLPNHTGNNILFTATGAYFNNKIFSRRYGLMAYNFGDIYSSAEVNDINSNYVLYQNYPNPFNPITNIKFEISERVPVSLKVFNILGSQLAELINEVREAGVYEIEFNGRNFASGTYFIKLTAGDFTETRKMILIK